MNRLRVPPVTPAQSVAPARLRADGVEEGRVWAVASGSGGVGRSTFAAALGARMSRRGRSTCLVDADWTSPSLAPLLDVEGGGTTSPWTAHALVPLRSSTHESLRVVAGAPPTGGDPSRADGRRLLERIDELPASQIVVDLPAGSSDVALDLWLAADYPVLVTVPERLPLDATARLLARVFARRTEPWLARRMGAAAARGLMAEAWDRCAGRTGTWMRSVAQLAKVEPEQLSACASGQEIYLVLNRARRGDDVDVGHALVVAAGHGLGIELRFRGVLPQDDEGWIRARRHQGAAPGQPGDLLCGEIDDFLDRMAVGRDVPQPGDWKSSLKEAALHAAGG